MDSNTLMMSVNMRPIGLHLSICVSLSSSLGGLKTSRSHAVRLGIVSIIAYPIMIHYRMFSTARSAATTGCLGKAGT